jgi:hypothetical protein
MVSTVTSSTISTITTTTGGTLAAAVAVVAVVALIGLLMTKELASATQSGKAGLIARFCDVGIFPLVVAFAVTVGIKVVQILA